MNHRGAVIEQIKRLLEFFAPHCKDRETNTQLLAMLVTPTDWHLAHGLFNQIRKKTLVAEAARSEALTAQYVFEEVCAKTLYNLSGESAPFDADSPYWVVPNALTLANLLRLDEKAVLGLVARPR